MNAEATRCQFPALPKTVKTYKSQRAAKLAATKAEAAYELALRNRCTDEYHAPSRLGDDLVSRVNDYMSAAFGNLVSTIEAVKKQGFYASSWHVGPNATRDLIAANMD